MGLVASVRKSVTLASLCGVVCMAMAACGPKTSTNNNAAHSGHDHSKPENSGFFVDPASIIGSVEGSEDRSFFANEGVSPCDDLHAYVCEEVESNFELPKGQSEYIFSLFDSATRIQEKRTAEFTRMSNDRTSQDPLTQMFHNFIQSCLNLPARLQEEQAVLADLRNKLDQAKTKEELFEMMSRQVASIEFSLVSMNIRPNFDNPRVSDVFLDFRHLMSLQNKEIYQRNDLLNRYLNIVTRFFEQIGYEDYEDRAFEMVSFERAIALEHVGSKEMQEVYTANKPVSRQELIERYPRFGLQNFFSMLPESTVVHDIARPQLMKFHELLGQVELEVLKDMVLYHSLNEQLQFSTPKARAAQQQLLQEFLGVPKEAEQAIAQKCLLETNDRFLRNVDAKIIDEMFADFDKKAFDEMVEQIRAQLITRVKNNEWISDTGRAGAINKLEKMSFLSVKPEKEENWNKLPLLDFNNTTYIANKKAIEQSAFERQMRELGQENTDLWPRSPLEVNAFYLPQRNQFVIPQGILQPPLYDPKAPMHKNLGGIGVIIGHEIGHGVDPLGSQFDEVGKHREWMTEDDRATFTKNAGGLKKYFAQLGEDADLTHNENVADLSGLNVAFDTAFKAGGTVEQKREFFVQYGKTWCNVMTPERRAQKLQTDTHAQTPARINVPASHTNGFQEAFQCKEGDKLYIPPAERVKVW